MSRTAHHGPYVHACFLLPRRKPGSGRVLRRLSVSYRAIYSDRESTASSFPHFGSSEVFFSIRKVRRCRNRVIAQRQVGVPGQLAAPSGASHTARLERDVERLLTGNATGSNGSFELGFYRLARMRLTGVGTAAAFASSTLSQT